MRLFEVGILSTASSFALGVTIPVLSLLLLDKGLNLSSLALMTGLYSLVVVAAEIPSGIIGDRFGRKTCFILAKMLSAAGAVLLIVARSTYAFVLAMILMGLARAFISGSFEALAIDWYNQRFGIGTMHRITTRISIWDTLGLSAGSLAAGFITLWSGPSALLPGPYDGNFIISAALNVIIGIVAWIRVEEAKTESPVERPQPGVLPILRLIRSNRLLAVMIITSASTGFLLASIERYWQPRFMRIMLFREESTILLGILAFIGFMGALAGVVLSGRLIGSLRHHMLVQFILWRLCMVLAVVVLALAGSEVLFMGAYGMCYLLFGLAGVIEQVMVNRVIPARMRATMLSTVSFALQAGSLISSGFAAIWLAGPKGGIGGLWMISALIILLPTIPLIIRKEHFRTMLDS